MAWWRAVADCLVHADDVKAESFRLDEENVQVRCVSLSFISLLCSLSLSFVFPMHRRIPYPFLPFRLPVLVPCFLLFLSPPFSFLLLNPKPFPLIKET